MVVTFSFIKEENISNWCKFYDQSKEYWRNIEFSRILNNFVDYLISSYFHPTTFFKDSTFFTFKKQNQIIINEKEIKAKISDFLKLNDDDEICDSLYSIYNNIRTFNEKEFISLRVASSSERASFEFKVQISYV